MHRMELHISNRCCFYLVYYSVKSVGGLKVTVPGVLDMFGALQDMCVTYGCDIGREWVGAMELAAHIANIPRLAQGKRTCGAEVSHLSWAH